MTAIAFSSNGRRFASASLDKTVKVWEGSGVQFRPVCTNHSSEIYVGSMAISPDGKTIAAGCRDKFIWLWDVATRQARKWPSAPILDLYKPLAFTPDGATLVISERDGVCLRDVRTGASVGKLPEPGSPTAFAISPDGRVLASGGENGLIRLWDLPAQSPLPGFCLGYKEHIASLAFSPDGAFLAAGCYESIVSVWNISAGCEEARLTNHTYFVSAVLFTPDGKTLVSSSGDQTIRLWKGRAWEQEGVLKGAYGEIWSLACAPNGQTLISGGKDGSLKLWSPHLRSSRPIT